MPLHADALREYRREWMKKRRSAWITEHGPCQKCGSHLNLEVDHIDPTEKKMNPAMLWSMSPTNPKRITELAKCQVLCHICHKEKTLTEHRKYRSGTASIAAKLNAEQLSLVRNRLAAGDRNCDIARDLQITKFVISRIKRGIAYRY